MNKLKKPGPQPTSQPSSPSKPGAVVASSKLGQKNEYNTVEMVEPLTAREQFWATRALKAEALLSAQQTHHRELKSMSYTQEVKRTVSAVDRMAGIALMTVQRELENLMQQHKEKHTYLEKLVLVLATVIAVLVLVIIYLATHHTRHATNVQRHWLAGLPSHFTIPILSPFTSVVEKETSVFGTKAIAIITIVFGAVAFLVFRHWFNFTKMKQA